jgi:hypothetical protein
MDGKGGASLLLFLCSGQGFVVGGIGIAALPLQSVEEDEWVLVW